MKNRKGLTFSAYQVAAAQTAVYPKDIWVVGHSLATLHWVYPLIGLQGEVGELANKLKKIIRDTGGVVPAGMRMVIQEEVGDILWYLAMTCAELNLSLEGAAKGNVRKLASRKRRKVLHGSGDVR